MRERWREMEKRGRAGSERNIRKRASERAPPTAPHRTEPSTTSNGKKELSHPQPAKRPKMIPPTSKTIDRRVRPVCLVLSTNRTTLSAHLKSGQRPAQLTVERCLGVLGPRSKKAGRQAGSCLGNAAAFGSRDCSVSQTFVGGTATRQFEYAPTYFPCLSGVARREG
ncbi:hypothetical protein BKA81DRAFT_80433 [Phyllosticta paracitricarpa]